MGLLDWGVASRRINQSFTMLELGMKSPLLRFLCLGFVTFGGLVAVAPAQYSTGQKEFVKAPDGVVRFKLSNLTVKEDLRGTHFSFDYKKTADGEGTPQLRYRTKRGVSRVSGLPIRIDESGDIQLRDMFARTRSILNGGDDDLAIEFFLVADIGVGESFLVSNVISSGKLGSRLKVRQPNEADRKRLEALRIAKLPPRTVPAGHQRSNATTTLVPGTPCLYGSAGEWKPAVFVAISSPAYVKVKPLDSDQLRVVKRSEWLAISNEDLKAQQSNPGQYKLDFQVLEGSYLVIGEGYQPLAANQELVKGTPLRREYQSKWQDVFFLAKEPAAVRVLVRDSRGAKVEFVPHTKLVISQQALDGQSVAATKEKFASFVADVAQLNVGTASMERKTGFSNGVSSSSPTAVSSDRNPFGDPENKPASLGPVRTWQDKSGKFTIQAQLVRNEGTAVVLKRDDDRTVSVPIDRLSDADQEYLQKLGEKMSDVSASPFENDVEGPSTAAVDYSKILQPVAKITDLSWGAKSVAISPDNKLLMIGRKASCASLCELPSGRMIVDSGRMEHMGDVGVCAFTPDGKTMLMGGTKGLVEVYAVANDGSLKLVKQHQVHGAEITALSLSADGRLALTGATDKVVKYWEIQSGEVRAAITDFAGKIKATRIAPSGYELMATDGKLLKVYSTNESAVVKTLEVGRSHASGQAAAISADGKLLANGNSYAIELWDLELGAKVGVLEGKEINWSMRFGPDSRHLFAGGNGVIRIWDCERRLKVQENVIGKSFYVQNLTVSPDGSMVSAPCEFSAVIVLKAGQ